MKSIRIFAISAVVAFVLLPAARADAALTALYSSLLATTANAATNGVVNDLAFDDKHGVYLRVWDGLTFVWGRFIGLDGQPKGDAFVIDDARAGYSGWVRAAYSSGSADDVFLVLYASDYAGNKNIYGRLVRYTGTGTTGGQFVAPSAPLPGLGSFAVSEFSLTRTIIQTPGDVVFDPNRRRFLAVWEDSRGSWDVVVRLFSPTGAALSGDVNVSRGAGAQGAPAAAFDWQNDRYFIVYHGTHPNFLSPELLGIWGKLLTGDTLTIMHTEATDGLIEIYGGAVAMESSVVYLPERGAFVAAWMDFVGSNRNVEGRLIPWNFGDPGVTYLSGVYPLMNLASNEGAPSLAYNPATRTVLLGSMWDPGPIRGVELSGYNGQPMTLPYGLTETLGGSYNPSIAAGSGGKFAVGFITDYKFSWLEHFQGTLAATPGPTPPGNGTPPTPTPTPAPIVNAALTSPTPGATLTGSSQMFTWTAGSNATAYWLNVGRTQGGYDIFSNYVGGSLSYPINGLPTDGGPVWVRLLSLVNGSWSVFTDYRFNAVALSQPARLTSPAAGSTLNSNTATFSWSPGSGVSSYWVNIGTTQGGYNIYSNFVGQSLTLTVNNLPTSGGPVWLRLHSYINGAYQFLDYQFTASFFAIPASMVSPTPGAQLSSSTQGFNWSAGTNVSAYWLDVGTSLGGYNLWSNYHGWSLSAVINGLPANSPIYVRLWSLINGSWTFRDYSYTTGFARVAVINSHTPGQTLTGSTVTFTWTSGLGPTAYWLDIGSVQGGAEYYSNYQGTFRTRTVSGLPTNGGQMWVRLWSLINGNWNFIDLPVMASR